MNKIPVLFKLMEERKISQTKLSSDTKISMGNISDWKSGRSKPSSKALEILAKYFNVSVDYLLDTDEKDNGLTEKESELLAAFRDLPPEKQESVLALLRK